MGGSDERSLHTAFSPKDTGSTQPSSPTILCRLGTGIRETVRPNQTFHHPFRNASKNQRPSVGLFDQLANSFNPPTAMA